MAGAFNLTAQLNLRGPANVGAVVSNIRRQLGSINANVNVTINPSTTRNVTQLNSALRNLNSTFGTTATSARNAAQAIGAFGNAINRININNASRQLSSTASALTKINNAAKGTSANVATASSEMQEFGRQAGLAVRRFAGFSIGTAAIFSITNAINKGVEAFIEYDRQFVKLQQVTGESAGGLQRLGDQITGLSTGLGVASADLTEVASTLAQAGLSARDTEKALKALALSALAPSFDNMNETVEGSIALMRQFGIGAGDLEGALGAVNAVAAKFAVESADIITAIQRTGGVFAAASKGVSEGQDALNEFIAVFTSVRATTRESAETIATGLRTIFTRIQRGGTIEALKEYGVNLQDLDGKFVGAYKAVQLLSEGLTKLDPRDIRFSRIVEELGGFRQIGKVIPLIQQFATAQDALTVAQKGQGSLAADAAKAQESLANRITKVREEFFALFKEIGKSDSFQNLVRGALDLASAMIKIADSVKGVLPALTIMAGFKGVSALTSFGAGFISGVRPQVGARRASGGYLSRYAVGGTVQEIPVALTPGEAVIYPEDAAKIGTPTLRRMNNADRMPRQRRASGGRIGIVPGQGNSDSFYTTLPEGSFVIRKAATEAMGPSNISDFVNGRQKFSEGGAAKKAKKPTGLPSTGPTEFTHITTSSTKIPKKLQEFSRQSGLGDIRRLYTNMGLDLPKTWNRNWAITEKDNYGAFSSMLSSFIKNRDVFKTLKSSGKIYRFTGRSKSPANEVLRNNDKEIRNVLSSKLKGNRFFDIDPQVEVVLPNLLQKSVEEVLDKDSKEAVALMSGFREISAYKGEGDKQRKKINKNMRSLLPKKQYGGYIQKFMEGSVEPLTFPGRSKFLKVINAMQASALIGGRDARKILGMKSRSGRDETDFKTLMEAYGEAVKSPTISTSRTTTETAALLEKITQTSTAPINTRRTVGAIGLTGQPGEQVVKSAQGTKIKVQKGVIDPGTSKRFRADVRRMSRELAKKWGGIFASQAGSTPVVSKKELDRILGPGLSNITGAVFEAALASAGAPYQATLTKRPIDFPQGLGKLGAIAGLPEDLATEAKTDLSSAALKRVATQADPTPRNKKRKRRKLKYGGFALVDDLPNAPGSLLPIPGISPGSPLYKIIKNKGGVLDYDRTLQRTVGDAAYANAKTDEQRSAVLDKYFRDPQARLKDAQTARLTQFGKQLRDLIQRGVIDPQKLSIISKSSKTEGLPEHINRLFGIPIKNMEFTSGQSKVSLLEEIRKRGPKAYRRYAVGGGVRDPKSTLEKYFEKSSALNAGLMKKGLLPRGGQGRKEQAARMTDMRSLETAAPSVLYSSLSRKAFDIMAMQTGLDKNPNIPQGTKYNDIEKIYNESVKDIIGKNFSLPGYASTSKTFSKAKMFLDNAPRSKDNWAAMMTIMTKKSARGVDVVDQLKGRETGKAKIDRKTGKTVYQKPPESEDEFILRSKSRFKINKANFIKLGADKNIWMDVQQFANGGSLYKNDKNKKLGYDSKKLAEFLGATPATTEKQKKLAEILNDGKIEKPNYEELLKKARGYAAGGEVPIMAQEGEYIINRNSARAIGYHNLENLNKYHSGGKVQALAKGGPTRYDRNVSASAAYSVQQLNLPNASSLIGQIKILTVSFTGLEKSLKASPALLKYLQGSVTNGAKAFQAAASSGQNSFLQLKRALEQDIVAMNAAGISGKKLESAMKALATINDVATVSTQRLATQQAAGLKILTGAVNQFMNKIPGFGSLGRIGNAFGGQAGFFTSMAIGALAGQGENLMGKPTTGEQAGNIAAFEGGLTTVSTGLSLATGLASINPVLGGIAAVGTAIIGIGDSLFDFSGTASKASREFEKAQVSKKLEESGERLSKILSDLASDINNIDLQNRAKRETEIQVEESKKLERTLVADRQEELRNQRVQNMSSLEYFGSFFNPSMYRGGTLDVGTSALDVEKDIQPIADKQAKIYEDASRASMMRLEQELKRGVGLRQGIQDANLSTSEKRAILGATDPATSAKIILLEQKRADALAAGNNLLAENLQAESNALINESLLNNKRLETIQKTIEMNQALEEAANKTKEFSMAFERVNNIYTQSSNVLKFNNEELDRATQSAIDSLTGVSRISIGTPNTMNILENQTMFSREQVAAAAATATRPFGDSGREIEEILKFNPQDLSDSILGIFDNVKQGQNVDEVIQIAEKTLRDNIKDLPKALQEQLLAEFKGIAGKAQEAGKTSGDPVGELYRGLDQLGSSATQLQKQMLDLVKTIQTDLLNTLRDFGNALNERNAAIMKSIELESKAQDIRNEGADKLSSTLGFGNVDVGVVQARQNARISNLTGGITDPKQISQDIINKQKRQQELESELRTNTDLGTEEGANKAKKAALELGELTLSIEKNKQALDILANSTDVASAALGKIQTIMDAMQGQGEFLDKLATATPEEAQKLNDTFIRLQNTMNGQLNTARNSIEAQRAYIKTLRQTGGNRFAAARAGNAVLAQQRGEGLALFRELIPVFKSQMLQQGMTEEQSQQRINQMYGRVTAGTYAEAGLLNNPMLAGLAQQTIQFRNDPRSNPAIAGLMGVYNAANENQAQAVQEQASMEQMKAAVIFSAAVEKFNTNIDSIKQNAEKAASGRRASGDLETLPPQQGVPLKPRANMANTGGIIKLAAGGLVPTKLTPRELVIEPEGVNQIGLNNLEKINTAGRNNGGILHRNNGGLTRISNNISEVPGSRTHADTYPSGNRAQMLKEGSYVLNEKASDMVRASGFNFKALSFSAMTANKGGVIGLNDGSRKPLRSRPNRETSSGRQLKKDETIEQDRAKVETDIQTQGSNYGVSQQDQEESTRLRNERIAADQEQVFITSGAMVDQSARQWTQEQFGPSEWNNMTEDQRNAEIQKNLPRFQQLGQDYTARRDAYVAEKGKQDEATGLWSKDRFTTEYRLSFFREEKERSQAAYAAAAKAEQDKQTKIMETNESAERFARSELQRRTDLENARQIAYGEKEVFVPLKKVSTDGKGNLTMVDWKPGEREAEIQKRKDEAFALVNTEEQKQGLPLTTNDQTTTPAATQAAQQANEAKTAAATAAATATQTSGATTSSTGQQKAPSSPADTRTRGQIIRDNSRRTFLFGKGMEKMTDQEKSEYDKLVLEERSRNSGFKGKTTQELLDARAAKRSKEEEKEKVREEKRTVLEAKRTESLLKKYSELQSQDDYTRWQYEESLSEKDKSRLQAGLKAQKEARLAAEKQAKEDAIQARSDKVNQFGETYLSLDTSDPMNPKLANSYEYDYKENVLRIKSGDSVVAQESMDVYEYSRVVRAAKEREKEIPRIKEQAQLQAQQQKEQEDKVKAQEVAIDQERKKEEQFQANKEQAAANLDYQLRLSELRATGQLETGNIPEDIRKSVEREISSSFIQKEAERKSSARYVDLVRAGKSREEALNESRKVRESILQGGSGALDAAQNSALQEQIARDFKSKLDTRISKAEAEVDKTTIRNDQGEIVGYQAIVDGKVVPLSELKSSDEYAPTLADRAQRLNEVRSTRARLLQAEQSSLAQLKTIEKEEEASGVMGSIGRGIVDFSRELRGDYGPDYIEKLKAAERAKVEEARKGLDLLASRGAQYAGQSRQSVERANKGFDKEGKEIEQYNQQADAATRDVSTAAAVAAGLATGGTSLVGAVVTDVGIGLATTGAAELSLASAGRQTTDQAINNTLTDAAFNTAFAGAGSIAGRVLRAGSGVASEAAQTAAKTERATRRASSAASVATRESSQAATRSAREAAEETAERYVKDVPLSSYSEGQAAVARAARESTESAATKAAKETASSPKADKVWKTLNNNSDAAPPAYRIANISETSDSIIYTLDDGTIKTVKKKLSPSQIKASKAADARTQARAEFVRIIKQRKEAAQRLNVYQMQENLGSDPMTLRQILEKNKQPIDYLWNPKSWRSSSRSFDPNVMARRNQALEDMALVRSSNKDARKLGTKKMSGRLLGKTKPKSTWESVKEAWESENPYFRARKANREAAEKVQRMKNDDLNKKWTDLENMDTSSSPVKRSDPFGVKREAADAMKARRLASVKEQLRKKGKGATFRNDLSGELEVDDAYARSAVTQEILRQTRRVDPVTAQTNRLQNAERQQLKKARQQVKNNVLSPRQIRFGMGLDEIEFKLSDKRMAKSRAESVAKSQAEKIARDSELALSQNQAAEARALADEQIRKTQEMIEAGRKQRPKPKTGGFPVSSDDLLRWNRMNDPAYAGSRSTRAAAASAAKDPVTVARSIDTGASKPPLATAKENVVLQQLDEAPVTRTQVAEQTSQNTQQDPMRNRFIINMGRDEFIEKRKLLGLSEKELDQNVTGWKFRIYPSDIQSQSSIEKFLLDNKDIIEQAKFLEDKWTVYMGTRSAIESLTAKAKPALLDTGIAKPLLESPDKSFSGFGGRFDPRPVPMAQQSGSSLQPDLATRITEIKQNQGRIPTDNTILAETGFFGSYRGVPTTPVMKRYLGIKRGNYGLPKGWTEEKLNEAIEKEYSIIEQALSESSSLFNSGGIVYANNGAFISAASKGSDRQLAMLTEGEYVVSKPYAAKYGGLLNAINTGHFDRGGAPQYLANGGIVGAKYYSGGGMASGGSGVPGVSSNSIQTVNGQITVDKQVGGLIKSLTDHVGEIVGGLTLQAGGLVKQYAEQLEKFNVGGHVDITSNINHNVQHYGLGGAVNNDVAIKEANNIIAQNLFKQTDGAAGSNGSIIS